MMLDMRGVMPDHAIVGGAAVDGGAGVFAYRASAIRADEAVTTGRSSRVVRRGFLLGGSATAQLPAPVTRRLRSPHAPAARLPSC